MPKEYDFMYIKGILKVCESEPPKVGNEEKKSNWLAVSTCEKIKIVSRKVCEITQHHEFLFHQSKRRIIEKRTETYKKFA